jgi:hypothetical protein
VIPLLGYVVVALYGIVLSLRRRESDFKES